MRDSHYPTSGDPIVFFDFETTGLCSKNDSIIEIAAVKYVPGAASHPHMQQLIAIDRPLPRFITKLTGITDDMLRTDGRRMDEVLDEFIEFIGDHTVVAFNINFDTRFLNAAIERHRRRPLNNVGHCALARARLAWPDLPSHKLVHLAKHLDLDVGVAHRALNDSLLALEVYFRSFEVERSRGSERAVSKTISTGAPSIIPTIAGPRQFRIEVLGTRRNQEPFEALCGPRTDKGTVLDIQVQLRVETNSNAVKVLLQEEVVGNLATRVAQDFRRAIIDGDLAEFRHFECSAKIRGGKISDSSTDGHYVMWLDIPQDDD
ncbi:MULTISPECIES: PolC-type DNA polymerase III [unclassified Massilia]|uniref:3'-5' exonuclease n=1 Tax=unclassified Massilia TaxID=2609279 RepID=UPI00177C0C8B|nr:MULTISPECIES: 3'-5' exonuclease [unclassified Massilia]MBD8530309.1 3'-5' exonuclease [Massilia sp. CFBP 13647]MBD8673086.1 3'-5' exonuclease [Massilia sp. CFBP 13721]